MRSSGVVDMSSWLKNLKRVQRRIAHQLPVLNYVVGALRQKSILVSQCAFWFRQSNGMVYAWLAHSVLILGRCRVACIRFRLQW